MAGIRWRPLRRTGSTGVPNVANMAEGEIAVNSFDRKIWMKVGSNLIEVANAASGDWNTLANKPNITADGQNIVTRDVTATRGDQTGALFFGSTNSGRRYLFFNGTEYLLGGGVGQPDYQVWTEQWTGHRRALGNGSSFQVFDDNRDIACAEMRGGWNNGTDRVGYIVNRNMQPLRIAGRNGQVYLGIGETASISTLANSALQLTNNAFIANSDYGVQNVALAMRWNGNSIWNIGTENNGDFKIWSYTDVGVYKGNPITITGAGFLTLAGTMRVTGELKQGASDAGWGMTWNTVASGVGASEYTNNRQGGSGGHIFSTRQNETQTPQQHHHLLSDGKMNIRTASGGWVNQPRLFSGGGDPGAAASPGDIWFQEV